MGRSASPSRRKAVKKTQESETKTAAAPAASPSPRNRKVKRAASPSPAPVVKQKAAAKAMEHKEEVREFGGVPGNIGLILFSHAVLYYFYYCMFMQEEGKVGHLWLPTSWAEAQPELMRLWANVVPTWTALALYGGFILFHALLAYVAPGLIVKGRPDDNGTVNTYNCNACWAWWLSLIALGGLHYSELLKLDLVYTNFGAIMTVAIIWADVQSAIMYAWAFATNTTHRMSGNHIYDFFMGALLHPRVPFPLLSDVALDVKMFAEIRLSWFLLFLLTASCAAAQYSQQGVVTPGMWFMVLAHFLYANACAKGEHYVPPTWDITYEKYGWMLCFWNFAGVPFLYCAQSVYILRTKGETTANYPTWVWVAMFATLLFFYWIWDTCGSQKNHFRLETSGVTVHRKTFPQLPWQIIKNPKFLKTKRGTPLLVDGWYKYCRKIHYTCDVVFAGLWGMSCGFDCFTPYFYLVFFTAMIIHRYLRDVDRCRKNYGADWKTYEATVRYIFIPYVF